ncbi:DUF4259 domain-containing protein [Jeongeupia wiesaeckerbachi]
MRALFILMFISINAFAGAWSENSFGNDDALDWVAECVDSKSAEIVSATLISALNAKYIEAPQGAAAVAAAEVVAAARGKANAAMPQELNKWLALQSAPKLVELSPIAKKVLLKIRHKESSELYQLWSENGAEKWLATVKDLEVRLGK